MKRKIKFYLCRNARAGRLGDYVFYARHVQPPTRGEYYARGEWWYGDAHACEDAIHAHGIRLRPGQGPVEVKLSVVRKRGGK